MTTKVKSNTNKSSKTVVAKATKTPKSAVSATVKAKKPLKVAKVKVAKLATVAAKAEIKVKKTVIKAKKDIKTSLEALIISKVEVPTAEKLIVPPVLIQKVKIEPKVEGKNQIIKYSDIAQKWAPTQFEKSDDAAALLEFGKVNIKNTPPKLWKVVSTAADLNSIALPRFEDRRG